LVAPRGTKDLVDSARSIATPSEVQKGEGCCENQTQKKFNHEDD